MRRGWHQPAIGLAAMAALLAVTASPAGASITLGQLSDPGISSCGANLDLVQANVAPGSNPYTVPASGTITSWSTIAVAPAGVRATLKVFRRTADPTMFQAVGFDGPETLTPLGTLTFPAHIPVKPGDLLGLHAVDTLKCAFASAGSQVRYGTADAQAGQTATLGMVGDNTLLDIQATLVPDNGFSRVGKVKLNTKKGTASATFDLPNPGVLTGSGGGAKVTSSEAAASKKIPAAGRAKLVIKAKGAKLRTLNQSGKVTLKLTIKYTPTGGDRRTQKLKVKLLKR